MKVLEEFGKTVDEARQKAFRALGIQSEQQEGVEVEVLDEGSPGNDSGWGRKLARIKVTVRSSRPAPAPAPAPTPAVAVATHAHADSEDADVEDADAEYEDEEGEEDDESAPIVLEDILDLMHLQASVEEEEQDGQLVLNIVGPDLGILIGKHGQTLEALQFLVNLIVNHNVTERTRVIVDVSGYRARRERTLRELAQRMARRAHDEQCNIALEPMTASERRIIHISLAEDPRVETYSQGEEPMRKVIIAPRR